MQRAEQQSSDVDPSTITNRRVKDRRISKERRKDPRVTSPPKRSLQAWVRSLFNPRIGVDRRKGADQRSNNSSNTSKLSSLLSQDELRDLLE